MNDEVTITAPSISTILAIAIPWIVGVFYIGYRIGFAAAEAFIWLRHGSSVTFVRGNLDAAAKQAEAKEERL